MAKSDLDLLRADFTRKDLNETVRELTFRLERDPKDAQAWNHLGFTYHALGRADEAVEAFREALRVSPDLRDPSFNLGTLLTARGGQKEAIRHFESVLRAEPDCVECRVRMGNALRDLGRLDEATTRLEEAVELDRGHAWAQYSLGIALQLSGRVDEAIERYRTVVRLDPEDVGARLSLGSALTGAGRCTPAVATLEDAVRLEPEWPETLSRLAWALASCPQSSPDALARAVAYARRAAELSGFADAGVLDTLGDTLAASGDFAQSRTAYERALVLAERAGNTGLAEEIRRKLAGFLP